MTVRVEQIEGAIPHRTILTAGLACTLLFLYLTYLNDLADTKVFSVFGGLAFLAAVIWGSDTLKILQSYGLATGHPSAGMIALGAGVIPMLFATRFGLLSPVVAVVVACGMGIVVGYLANHVLQMKVPVMIASLAELSAVGACSLLGLSALITGGLSWQDLTAGAAGSGLPGSYVGGGLLVLAFMLAAFAVQHPFNASSGPGWRQDRMLVLAAECACLSLIVAAILSFPFVGTVPAIVSLLLAVAGWGSTYARFIALSRRDAFAWLDARPIAETEGA